MIVLKQFIQLADKWGFFLIVKKEKVNQLETVCEKITRIVGFDSGLYPLVFNTKCARYSNLTFFFYLYYLTEKIIIVFAVF